MFVKQMTVGMMAVCCYLVCCEETRKGLIIDPGGNDDDVIKACKDENIDVKYIVNTHGHPDHVCGNGAIKSATGASIVMHEEDADFFARSDIDQFFSSLGLTPSPPVDIKVKDGDTIKIGNVSLEVILTPGHTPGGICLYSPPHLFTGDTLFVGAVGRTDFPGGDTNTLLTSLKKRLLPLPAETIVWPGHGYGGLRSTIGEESRTNPYLGFARK